MASYSDIISKDKSLFKKQIIYLWIYGLHGFCFLTVHQNHVADSLFFKTCSLFIILPFISEALIYFLCGIASCLCSHTTPHPKCCSCCQVQTFILKMSLIKDGQPVGGNFLLRFYSSWCIVWKWRRAGGKGRRKNDFYVWQLLIFHVRKKEKYFSLQIDLINRWRFIYGPIIQIIVRSLLLLLLLQEVS